MERDSAGIDEAGSGIQVGFRAKCSLTENIARDFHVNGIINQDSHPKNTAMTAKESISPCAKIAAHKLRPDHM